MKKILLFITLLICAVSLNAQSVIITGTSGKILKNIQKSLNCSKTDAQKICLLSSITMTGYDNQGRPIYKFELEQDYFNRKMMNNITYFGVDFTYANIKLGIAKRSEYSKSFFEDFNDFIILYCNEFFNISNKEFTKNRNVNINLDHIYNNYNTKNINITTIQKVISSLKTIEKTNSIGIIIFITEMDKIKETERFTICYFDIDNKKIIGFDNIVAEARGVGMANHWTRPVIDFLQDPLSVKFNFYTFE
jgi:hypothetical protein